MIDLIFTIDYEIYGNGQGSLRDLVHRPAEQLWSIFRKRRLPFVCFVEAAELERIEEQRSDEAIDDVLGQVRAMHANGIEIGMHLHPQWYNGRYDRGAWTLDAAEYNLCSLPERRIEAILDRSTAYLRRVLGVPDFTPLAFRAGNWLLQPTGTAAAAIARKGIRIDSSVFKGGLQQSLGLDYRAACKNGYYWRFRSDVNTHDPDGLLFELPTYTAMVPIWRMATKKRVRLDRRAPASAGQRAAKFERYLDFLRFRYPLKLDFCRMTLPELVRMMEPVIAEDQTSPGVYRPLVAIGHTKDLTDLPTVDAFLGYLEQKKIRSVAFRDVYRRLNNDRPGERA